jgi:hypothetical protein
MDTSSMMLVAVLLYGAFLGYCFGRAVGYSKGADMAEKIYTRK